MHAFCARRVGETDAADATADVFAVAWRRIDDIPTDGGRPWLFGVARNTVLNRWRTKRRQARLLGRVRGDRGPVPVGPDVEVDRTEEARAVLAALRSLRPADQEVLVMTAWDEMPRTQIADVLGVSVAAADQRIHRAKRRLADALRPSAPFQGATPGSTRGERP